MTPRHWITDPVALLFSTVIALGGAAILGALLLLEIAIDGKPMQ